MNPIVRIAWGNTFQNRRRTLAALGGIAFSILLVFLQLGFLQAAKTQVTLLFDDLDFDAAMVGERYQILATAPEFDRRRLIQAAVDPDVTDTFKLNVQGSRWFNPETLIESSLLVIGLDDKPDFIRDPQLREGMKTLRDGRSVILDRFSHPDYGEKTVGLKGNVRNQDVEATALFDLGLFFYAEGSIATNESNFLRLTGRRINDVTIGLIKLRKGADAEAAVKRIRGLVPSDVVVMTRDRLIAEERGYFVSVKPVGIMFQSAVLVAFVVGLVILFQILVTEINNRMQEYATMKAMGFGNRFVYGIGITQNLIFIAFSFLPAFLMSAGLFHLVYVLSRLPTRMTLRLAVTVLLLTLVMGVVAGLLAMRRIRRADPADLF
jgi:putative ABC transport system permease protein